MAIGQEVIELSGVVFRCDGSPSIGMGHVVRCSALAHALLERNCPVWFVVRDSCTKAITYLKRAGFEVSMVCNPHNAQDTELKEDDLNDTIKVARQIDANHVLVDHYGAAGDYLAGLKNAKICVGVIDDLADRDLSAADWLLNQNLSAQSLIYRVRSDCIKLLGPAYALLRPQFAAARKKMKRTFSTEDRHILITLGGGDTALACSWVLKALNGVSRRLEIRCLLGGDAPTPTVLTESAAASAHQVQILRNVDNMAEQIVWADLAISAGGSTCWELCCLGLPMIILILADNQEPNAFALGTESCARILGWWNQDTSEFKLVQWVEELLTDPQARADMSARIWQLVDGLGAARAADSLLTIIAKHSERSS